MQNSEAILLSFIKKNKFFLHVFIGTDKRLLVVSYQPLISRWQTGSVMLSTTPWAWPWLCFGTCVTLCHHQLNQPGKISTWAELRGQNHFLFGLDSIVRNVNVRGFGFGAFLITLAGPELPCPLWALLQGATWRLVAAISFQQKEFWTNLWAPMGQSCPQTIVVYEFSLALPL